MLLNKVINGQPIDFRPDELIWYVNNQAGNGDRAMYGISRIARVLNLLEVRDQIIENIDSIMKNQARPPIMWKVKSSGDVQTLKVLLNYIKNAGNTAEVLSLITKDWVPTATSNYVSVTWNLQVFLLTPGASTRADLALTVSPNIVNITDFTANLIISGTT